MGDQEASWAVLWEQLQRLFWNYAGHLGPPLTPINLLATFALCLVLWLIWRPAQGFLAWVFPARVYRSPSFWMDVRLMVLNWFIGLFTTLNYATIAAVTAGAVGLSLGIAPVMGGGGAPVLSALVIFLAGDLTMYGYHRLTHERPTLWAFHAVHHSAEELSPVTAFRHHPLYSILSGLLVSVMVGLAQGLAMAFLFGRLDVATILGTNLFTGILNLAANNLKHSHIWLRFPPWVEHVLISPAQHQVHHSTDPKHFNKNFGDILAVWDWGFGTLYVTRPGEVIRFGLADATGRLTAQRHPTLRHALVEPIARLRGLLRRKG